MAARSREKLTYDSRRAWCWCGGEPECGKLVREDIWFEAFGKKFCAFLAGCNLHGNDASALYLLVDVVIFHIDVLGF